VPRLATIPVGAALVLLAALAWLARLERGGPPHVDLELAGGAPARFYVPGRPQPFGLPEPPAPGARPPGLVLCHGFSADRAMMSTLARRLAASGYAVLAIDARGHGENRASFGGGGRPDHLYPEFEAAIDFLRASPQVDGERLAVMGHSMGAAAALDYATRDPGLGATVLVSGGWVLEGPHRPPNALFIYASGDPPGLREASDALAARLEAEQGGDDASHLADGTGVRVVEVPGNDHLTILWSRAAAAEIVAWLDAALGVERRGEPGLADPRLAASGLAFLALLFAAPGIGWLAGRLAPAREPGSAAGSLARLGAVALALLLALPLAAGEVPTEILSQEVSPQVVAYYLAAGLLLLGGMALRGGLAGARLREGLGASVAAAGLAFVLVALATTPLGVVFHRLALTPARAASALLGAAATFPLVLALELALRRGGTLAALGLALTGRALVFGVMLAGVLAGALPWILTLMLPALVPLVALMELVTTPLYAVSRNRLAIALLQSAWLAWIQAAILPSYG
jgi:dienelactone hydrolase